MKIEWKSVQSPSVNKKTYSVCVWVYGWVCVGVGVCVPAGVCVCVCALSHMLALGRTLAGSRAEMMK